MVPRRGSPPTSTNCFPPFLLVLSPHINAAASRLSAVGEVALYRVFEEEPRAETAALRRRVLSHIQVDLGYPFSHVHENAVDDNRFITGAVDTAIDPLKAA